MTVKKTKKPTSKKTSPKKATKDASNFLSDVEIRKIITKSPLFLDAEDEAHVSNFRRILEISLSQGRWSGEMPRIS
jgi:hypothetical protein